MQKSIKLLELFSGIQSQERALRQLKIPYESVGVCDCDKDVLVASAAMRFDLEKEIENYDFPDTETMIKELQDKNIGYSFEKQKHTITSRTPISKLKQYYISDKLLKNLGDISKVERLPRANFVTYSSPCQSFSVAGKLAGAAKTCTKCGHKWDIDFSNPDYNYKCPVCGNASLESTTSGLLQEVQRLLSIAYEENELPEYLMLENVKNLVQKKFIGQFDAWVKWLDSIGYNTYWKILNAKNFGVPQNRERCFAISIRKDVDTNGFTFPEPIPLTTRLKDILEQNVDEKYYLPDERIEKILNSSFMQEKKRIQMTDVCDTLLARDWKDPKCVPIEEELEVRQIMNIMPGTNRDNPNQGRVYDKEGIAPTLSTMSGGNRQPFVIEEIKVIGNYMPSNHDASRVVDIDGIAPTVKENHGTVTAIAEPQIDIKERFFRQVAETIIENQCEPGDTIDAFNKKVNHSGVSPTITTRPEGFKTAILPIVEEPFIVASRGRNPENPSDRTTGTPTEQRLEPNFSGTTNCLTSVVKDNYVCEPMIVQNPHGFNKGSVQEECPSITSSYFQENNYVAEPIAYDDYNSRISADQDTINTLTCNCGKPTERNGVKIIEPVIIEDFYQSREPRVYSEVAPTLRSERNGLKVADEIEYPCSTRGKQVASAIRASIYKQGARNLEENVVNGLGYEGVIEKEQPKIKWRIRKLTPLECWMLMAFSKQDHDRAAKYVSTSARYKMAGNSIVTNVLVAIFASLFLENGYKSQIWTKYVLNIFNDTKNDNYGKYNI